MTYTTIEGKVLDLSGLTPDELAFFERCLAAQRAGATWSAMMSLIRGVENPLLRATGGITTQAVYDHPLYRAVRDLEDRAGIQQGFLRWDRPVEEPTGDEWVSPSAAADEKGVSVQAIHGAIQRGEIVARGITRKLVSQRSLQSWAPLAVRQRAGRVRARKAEESQAE